jgi:hypothetical protein
MGHLQIVRLAIEKQDTVLQSARYPRSRSRFLNAIFESKRAIQ